MARRRRKTRSRRRGRTLSVSEAQRLLKPGRQQIKRLLVVVAVLLILLVLDRLDLGIYETGDMTRYHGQSFRVVHVVDGDTLDVDVPDGDSPQTRVRLWGIDTPELGKPWQTAEPGAEEARARLSTLAEGRTVTLQLLDHRIRGQYGRLLAYVTGPAGEDLAEKMLESGWAEADDRWSHPRRTKFELLEETARRRGLGLWSVEE